MSSHSCKGRAREAASLLACLAVGVGFATAATDKELTFIGARAKYWAFQKVVSPSGSELTARAGFEHQSTRSFWKALNEKQLTPSRHSIRAQLLRRVTYDLTGLPPTPEEVYGVPEGHVARRIRKGGRPPARLAALWRALGTKWLDIVRYADTNGFELDQDRPHAWRYRDYVIDSFNTDKPFDRFIQEQIAGDEMFPGNKEALIATGYLRAGSEHMVSGNIDPEESRQEVLTEIATNVGQTFPRHDGQLRPLPQSQVRSDPAGRLLSSAGRLRRSERQGCRDRDAAEEKEAWEAAEQDYKERIEPDRKGTKRAGASHLTRRSRKSGRAKLEPEAAEALDMPKDKRTPEQQTPRKECGDADQAGLGRSRRSHAGRREGRAREAARAAS